MLPNTPGSTAFLAGRVRRGGYLPLTPNTCRPNIKGCIHRNTYTVPMLPSKEHTQSTEKEQKLKKLKNSEHVNIY
jgi:hypothetical protein